MSDQIPLVVRNGERILTSAEFNALADVPPEVEWFANVANSNTRRAYRIDMREFRRFVGIVQPDEFRRVTRAHVIAWRKEMERQGLAISSIRRQTFVPSHPCLTGFARATPLRLIRSTGLPARSRVRTRAKPRPCPTCKPSGCWMRQTARPSRASVTGQFWPCCCITHCAGRNICSIRVEDYALRRGVPTLAVHGKGGKIRYLPVHPAAVGLIENYLEAGGHRTDATGALFRPVKSRMGNLKNAISGTAIYESIVKHYAAAAGIPLAAIRPHGLRATAATNALENGADIAKVQEWLGHSNISTTRAI